MSEFKIGTIVQMDPKERWLSKLEGGDTGLILCTFSLSARMKDDYLLSYDFFVTLKYNSEWANTQARIWGYDKDHLIVKSYV